jgi:uncharacterized protein YoxC
MSPVGFPSYSPCHERPPGQRTTFGSGRTFDPRRDRGPRILRVGSTHLLLPLREAMETHIPAALQTALYVGSVAVTVLVVAMIALLLQVRGQLERVVRSVEELKAEMTPLARDTRVVVGDLRELSGRVRERWMEVEGIIDTARSWSQRASQLWKSGVSWWTRPSSR